MKIDDVLHLKRLELQAFASAKKDDDDERENIGGYGRGSGYSNRETAYQWKDGTTTYSNATRYEDAAKEAGKEGVGLSRATTYSTKKDEPLGFTDDIYSNDGRSGTAYFGDYDYDLYDYVNGNIPAFNELYGGGGNRYTPQQQFYYGGRPDDYESEYKARQDALLSDLLNREAFSYDLENDPLWQNYKSQYIREGQRAMNDALAANASGAYGMNSYALSAAQQAQNYYNAQMTDMIPELQQLAYGMYLDDLQQDMANYGLLTDADMIAYDRYRDSVGDWYADRDFAYGLYRDDVADSRYDSEWAYALSRDAQEDELRDYETAYNQAIEFLSAGVMPSTELLRRAGISSGEAQSLLADNTRTVYVGGGGAVTGDDEEGYDDVIPDDATIQNDHNGYITIPGHGRFTYDEIEDYYYDGVVKEEYDPDTNSVKYVWNEGVR